MGADGYSNEYKIVYRKSFATPVAKQGRTVSTKIKERLKFIEMLLYYI